jgi:hypothetical protein
MTEEQTFGARRNPATSIDRRDEHAPNYYLDWAFDEMKKLVAISGHWPAFFDYLVGERKPRRRNLEGSVSAVLEIDDEVELRRSAG